MSGLTPCQQCQQALAQCRQLLEQEQGRSATAEALLREAQTALGEGAAALRKGASDLRVQTMTAGAEPHWLVKDFNVLYRAARRYLEESSRLLLSSPPQNDLRAQLERLKPAFTDTEEVRALLRQRRAGEGPCNE